MYNNVIYLLYLYRSLYGHRRTNLRNCWLVATLRKGNILFVGKECNNYVHFIIKNDEFFLGVIYVGRSSVI